MMKIAEIIPLYKGKERDEVVNYRPISLLMTISKLLEKIIYIRVYSFLEDHNILYDSQYGFRSKRSCNQAITKLTGRLLQAKEQSLHSTAIFWIYQKPSIPSIMRYYLLNCIDMVSEV